MPKNPIHEYTMKEPTALWTVISSTIPVSFWMNTVLVPVGMSLVHDWSPAHTAWAVVAPMWW